MDKRKRRKFFREIHKRRKELNNLSWVEKYFAEQLGIRKIKYRRNVPVWAGENGKKKWKCFLDFRLLRYNVAVELDGKEHDASKDAWRERMILANYPKLKFIRFTNAEVIRNPHAAIDKILIFVGEKKVEEPKLKEIKKSYPEQPFHQTRWGYTGPPKKPQFTIKPPDFKPRSFLRKKSEQEITEN